MNKKCTVTYSGQFKKDLKKHKKRSKEFNAIISVIDILVTRNISDIPKKMKPHKLTGDYKDFWECHILPDLLLIWDQGYTSLKFVHFVRLGSHSELF